MPEDIKSYILKIHLQNKDINIPPTVLLYLSYLSDCQRGWKEEVEEKRAMERKTDTKTIH